MLCTADAHFRLTREHDSLHTDLLALDLIIEHGSIDSAICQVEDEDEYYETRYICALTNSRYLLVPVS